MYNTLASIRQSCFNAHIKETRPNVFLFAFAIQYFCVLWPGAFACGCLCICFIIFLCTIDPILLVITKFSLKISKEKAHIQIVNNIARHRAQQTTNEGVKFLIKSDTSGWPQKFYVHVTFLYFRATLFGFNAI